MSDSGVCLRTEGGVKPIKDQRDILLSRCERLASCDGSLEIKIPAEIKDKYIIQNLQECNVVNQALAEAAEALQKRAARFSTELLWSVPTLQIGVEF